MKKANITKTKTIEWVNMKGYGLDAVRTSHPFVIRIYKDNDKKSYTTRLIISDEILKQININIESSQTQYVDIYFNKDNPRSFMLAPTQTGYKVCTGYSSKGMLSISFSHRKLAETIDLETTKIIICDYEVNAKDKVIYFGFE